jgi:hypothetical protein
MTQEDHNAVRMLVEAASKDVSGGDRFYYHAGDDDTPMLFCYLPAHGRAMLQKYGSAIVGMDATYKTVMWDMPLFLLSVVDNHGHGQPVGVFMVQSENAEQVASALRK